MKFYICISNRSKDISFKTPGAESAPSPPPPDLVGLTKLKRQETFFYNICKYTLEDHIFS